MRLLIICIVLLFTNNVLKAQIDTAKETSCTDYLKLTPDKMEGKTYVTSSRSVTASRDGGNKGLSIYLQKSDNSVIFSILSIGESACVDDKTSVKILFTDDTRLELVANNDFNCKGDVPIYFGGVFGKKNELRTLADKKIATMRVSMYEGFVQEDISKEDAEYLQSALKCIISYKNK